MKTLTFKLSSLTPMLMNKFSFGKKADQISVSDVDGLADAERTKPLAEAAAYRNSEGKLVIPADNVFRGLISAGRKVKRGQKTLGTVVAASVIVLKDLPLLDEKDKPLTDFATDIRRGKNPATKGSVPIIRARVDQWKGQLTLGYNPELIKEGELRNIVQTLGEQIGFLDFRPERSGCFGCFAVE
jgi:hypothetical protein